MRGPADENFTGQPYRARVSWVSLPCYGPGRADSFETLMGRAGAGCETLKCDGLGRTSAHPLNYFWAGPSPWPISKKLTYRVWPRPTTHEFDGSGRVAARREKNDGPG